MLGRTARWKECVPPANAGDARDVGLIPGSEKSPGVGNGNLLHYSCLENSTDRRAWQAIWSMGLQRVRHNRPQKHTPLNNCCSSQSSLLPFRPRKCAVSIPQNFINIFCLFSPETAPKHQDIIYLNLHWDKMSHFLYNLSKSPVPHALLLSSSFIAMKTWKPFFPRNESLLPVTPNKLVTQGI